METAIAVADDLGKALPAMPEALKTSATKVSTASQVDSLLHH
ncbi:MAG: hypothetical protein U1E15_09365 [Hyphomicrobiales bacterium]